VLSATIDKVLETVHREGLSDRATDVKGATTAYASSAPLIVELQRHYVVTVPAVPPPQGEPPNVDKIARHLVKMIPGDSPLKQRVSCESGPITNATLRTMSAEGQFRDLFGDAAIAPNPHDSGDAMHAARAEFGRAMLTPKKHQKTKDSKLDRLWQRVQDIPTSVIIERELGAACYDSGGELTEEARKLRAAIYTAWCAATSAPPKGKPDRRPLHDTSVARILRCFVD